MKTARFAEHHPYWFVVILEIVVIVIYLVAGIVAHFLNLSSLGLYGLANLSLTIIVAVLLTVMGWWKAVGFRSPDRRGDLLYFIVPFLPVVINLFPGVEIANFRYFLKVFVITLMVGFTEEGIFRGLMLNPLKTHGLWKAVIVTALLFGLTHALNVLAGKSFIEDVTQICFAVALGFAFAALVLKKGILWPLIMAHFLINFSNYLQQPGFTYTAPWSVLVPASLTVVFIVYGIFVMLQKNQMRLTYA